MTQETQTIASAPPPVFLGHARRGARRSTRDIILDVAEDLFGERGMSVSLREISAAAGQRNNSAPRYHFGNREGLLAAVMTDRVTKVDQLRMPMIEAHEPLDSQPLDVLLRIMWQPLLDLDQCRGKHAFIRFLLARLVDPTSPQHPIVTEPEDHPSTQRLVSALHGRVPHLSRDQFLYRLGLLSMMFWTAVSLHDRAIAATNQRWSARFSLDETIKLTVGALQSSA